MGPAIPAAIAAGASLIGGLFQNRMQQSSANKQMAFQERMSNTAYQRATHDMSLAGLSPYLAYQQGGATSPSGAQATVSDMIGPAVNSAMSAQRLRADIDAIGASAELSRASTLREGTAAGVNLANIDQIMQSITESKARTGSTLADQKKKTVIGRIWDAVGNLFPSPAGRAINKPQPMRFGPENTGKAIRKAFGETFQGVPKRIRKSMDEDIRVNPRRK